MKESSAGKMFAKYVSLNVLGMVALSCYILADTYFVAEGMGKTGLAGLNIAVPAFSFVNSCGMMLGIGAGTLYNIYASSGFRDRADRVYTQSVVTAAAISAVFVIVGATAAEDISYLLGANAETISYTAPYLRTIVCFAPLFVFNSLYLAFLRNDGAPRLAMLGMVVGSLTNVVLDYVFIFPLGLGMFGAALATGIAPAVSLCFQAFHFIRRRNTFHFVRTPLSLRRAGRICALGIPVFLTEMSTGVVMLIFNRLMLEQLGNLGVAAYGIAANIAIVVMAIFTGIMQGAQPVESYYYGRGDVSGQRKTLRYAVATSFVFAVLVYAVCAAFAENIADLFNGERAEGLTEIAARGIRLYFVCFVFAGPTIAVSGYMSATDKPRPAFAVTFTRGWVAIIPLAYIMSATAGVDGTWLSFTVAEATGFVLAAVLIAASLKKYALTDRFGNISYIRSERGTEVGKSVF